MWDNVGMGRNKAGLEKALVLIRELREDFWKNVKVPGKNEMVNTELEKALRVADYMEMGELIAKDALMREESCGGHFREEYQTPEGEAMRDDENFNFVGVWEYKGKDNEFELYKESLDYEFVQIQQRNYK